MSGLAELIGIGLDLLMFREEKSDQEYYTCGGKYSGHKFQRKARSGIEGLRFCVYQQSN